MYNEPTREFSNDGNAPPSKALHTPEETIVLAIAAQGLGVLYSRGHTQAAARSKAKNIKRGNPKVWAQWQGQIRTGAYKQVDNTWSVYIGWTGGDDEGVMTTAMLSRRMRLAEEQPPAATE